MKTLTENLLDLSDFAWQRLRNRVDGLTDDQYFWEPFDGSWSVRKTADGFRHDGFGEDGDRVPIEPPPFTTVAWRIAHIVDILQEDRTATWFGQEVAAADGQPPVPGSAAEAITALEHAYAVWRSRLAALTPEVLDQPIGAVGGPYAENDCTDFALHILDELIHHGAEVGTVLDIYRGQHGEDPVVAALLQGDPTADEIELARRQRPALVAEAAAARRWDAVPVLLELGFDVNAMTKTGKSAAHFAAGVGNLPILRQLIDHGADLSATDSDFGATPLGWAQWSNQQEAADFLTSAVGNSMNQ
jgi:hypothetical protein